jgi:hypothetical protein
MVWYGESRQDIDVAEAGKNQVIWERVGVHGCVLLTPGGDGVEWWEVS